MEMLSDVPLGAFLSGGVDSSSIVALMNDHSAGRKCRPTRSVSRPEDLKYDIIPDDAVWARRVGESAQHRLSRIHAKA